MSAPTPAPMAAPLPRVVVEAAAVVADDGAGNATTNGTIDGFGAKDLSVGGGEPRGEGQAGSKCGFHG